MQGFLLWQAGHKEEAVKHFENYMDYCQEQITAGSLFGRTFAQYDLASMYAFLGQKDKALKRSGWKLLLERTCWMLDTRVHRP